MTTGVRAEDRAPTALGENDLPALFRAADASSLRGQAWYQRGTGAILGSLVAAAVFGTLSVGGPGNAEVAGVAATIAFALSIVFSLALAQSRPEKRWYEGRALAESAKSLGWQYAVGGGRFPRGDDAQESEAEHRFRVEIGELIADIGEARPLEAAPGAQAITDAMRRLRATDLDARKAAYRTHRLMDQQSWYAAKARWNRTRGQWCLGLVILFQVLGVGLGVLRATGVLGTDLLGLAAAVSASVVAWMQMRNYGQLDEAYSLASNDLTVVEAGIGRVTEDAWPEWVANAEQAISREHRMWRASRVLLTRGPAGTGPG